MTTFLFYLLLHRLEHRLPTAVQLDQYNYYIFDGDGATIHKHSENMNARLKQCWALTDSNEDVKQPCRAFRKWAKCAIQMTSPEPSRWKNWRIQNDADLLISELPLDEEIVAIA